jgi:hypothetical protein
MVLNRLSNAAVVPCYPDGVFTKSEAQRALTTCKAFRKEARVSLGLPAK